MTGLSPGWRGRFYGLTFAVLLFPNFAGALLLPVLNREKVGMRGGDTI